MPLFEFECADCHEIFEELIFNGKQIPQCPKCGNKNVSKKIGLPGPLKKGAFPFKPGPPQKFSSFGGKYGGGCPGSCPK